MERTLDLRASSAATGPGSRWPGWATCRPSSVLHVLADTLADEPPPPRLARRPAGDGAGLLLRAGAAAVVSSESLFAGLRRRGRGVERVVELVVSERNRRVALAAGGVESGAGHYPVMVVLHTGLLVGRGGRGARSPTGRSCRGWAGRCSVLVLAARRCAGGASRPSAGSGTPASSSCPGCPRCAPGRTGGCGTPTTSPWWSRGSRCRWCTPPGSRPLVFTVANAVLLRTRIRLPRSAALRESRRCRAEPVDSGR